MLKSAVQLELSTEQDEMNKARFGPEFAAQIEAGRFNANQVL